jgi:hypothetical protein
MVIDVLISKRGETWRIEGSLDMYVKTPDGKPQVTVKLESGQFLFQGNPLEALNWLSSLLGVKSHNAPT